MLSDSIIRGGNRPGLARKGDLSVSLHDLLRHWHMRREKLCNQASLLLCQPVYKHLDVPTKALRVDLALSHVLVSC
jgi:hypothetical protein